MMQAKGFVLVVCLCFIAMVSSMALSALTISQLSQRIGMAGQLQTQRYLSMKVKHLRQLQQLASTPLAAASRTQCPPEYAVWTTKAQQCQLVQFGGKAIAAADAEPWGSVLWRKELSAVQRGQL